MGADIVNNLDGKIYVCGKCGGSRLDYRGLGRYRCLECGFITLDDFGKVKEFVDDPDRDNKSLDVSLSSLANLLREGRVEFKENSACFLRCVKCGRAIRYGRYCRSCASEMPKGAYTLAEVGDGQRQTRMHTWDFRKSK